MFNRWRIKSTLASLVVGTALFLGALSPAAVAGPAAARGEGAARLPAVQTEAKQDLRGNGDGTAGLLLPAVQSAREPAHGSSDKPENPGTLRGFNPQPEPPAVRSPREHTENLGTLGALDGRRGPSSGKLVNPGTLRGFNPQPEPPAVGGAGEAAPAQR